MRASLTVFVREKRGLIVVVVNVVVVDANLGCGVVLLLSELVVVRDLAPGHCEKGLIARGDAKAIGNNALLVKRAIKWQTCQKTARTAQAACESSSLCTFLGQQKNNQ